MNTGSLRKEDVIVVLKEAAVRMQANHVKQVRDLDAEIGDGDLGITVQKGFRAIEKYLEEASDETITDILKKSGNAFSEANPSTFSAFLATGFRKAAVTVMEKSEVDSTVIAAMFEAAVQGIMRLGKAQAGDKTMLDALIPATAAAKAASIQGKTAAGCLRDAEKAAEAGMKRTIDMVSKQGRARSFGERTRGVQDPGATVIALYLRELVEALDERTGRQA
ncbi:MAG: DAK2 domain-containing protein [Spirochaetes bacterium]|nr:DAK2 domain-containing protein [Spirochaetota bacterium]